MHRFVPHCRARQAVSLSRRGVSIAQLAVLLIFIGLAAAAALMGKQIMAIHHVRSQAAQIGEFDAAIENFHVKYEGLPGDLLAIMAQRQGLPAGNGTPGHGDGDGNISPCNPGWQWHLGCETALFWSHLYVSGMISDNFTADSRFVNNRLEQVGAMDPYLPKSPLGDGLYVAVWNTNLTQPSPRPQLPYGNYFEISRILGVSEERMRDDANAITPNQAKALDDKMDDGDPYNGRVVANGRADWPKDAWGTLARPGTSACVSQEKEYNIKYFLRAGTPLCHLAVRLECCEKSGKP